MMLLLFFFVCILTKVKIVSIYHTTVPLEFIWVRCDMVSKILGTIMKMIVQATFLSVSGYGDVIYVLTVNLHFENSTLFVQVAFPSHYCLLFITDPH